MISVYLLKIMEKQKNAKNVLCFTVLNKMENKIMKW